jgi:hypothetical protein
MVKIVLELATMTFNVILGKTKKNLQILEHGFFPEHIHLAEQDEFLKIIKDLGDMGIFPI